MTEQEKQEIILAVLNGLKVHSMTIDQLAPATVVGPDDNFEVGGGKRVSYATLLNSLTEDLQSLIKTLNGYIALDSIDELPQSKTNYGYLIGSLLYVWVGEGGDAVEGKYKTVAFAGSKGEPGNGIADIRVKESAVSGGSNIVTVVLDDGTEVSFSVKNGEKGESGVSLGEVVLVNDLTTGGEGKVLSAEMGKTLKGLIDSQTFPIVNDLTTGGEASALSAEQGKVLSGLIGFEELTKSMTVKYQRESTAGASPLFERGKTYTIHMQSDIATSQTYIEVWCKNQGGTRVKIVRLEAVDLSTEQTFTFTATQDLYTIGTPYSAGGTQPTGAYFTWWWKVGKTSDVIKLVDALDYGDFEIFSQTVAKNSTAAPCWVAKQQTPIMYANTKYHISIQASATYTPTKWELWVADYSLSTATRVKANTFEGVDLSVIRDFDYTPSADVYALYCGYFNGTADVNMTYNVKKIDDSKRLYEDEQDIKELQDMFDGAGINEFDSYFRLGATENDTINLITRPMGLIVMGQSNADGRIPNSSFPAHATIDTTDDLPLSKQLAHCLFMKGDQESTYGEGSKTFAGRNNSGNWAFDDIVYNAVNQALGGNTDFYVLKQTRGATGIQFANGSFNANVNNFAKHGYMISQLYHFKLLIERALELNPNIDFKAILWHQGEAEYQVTESGVYYRCLCQIIYWLRGKVGNHKLPFIFGTVPTDSEQYSAVVKADMEKVAQDINDCYLVDLGAAGDMIDQYHFGASTAERLAREMYKIMRQNYMLAPMINPL